MALTDRAQANAARESDGEISVEGNDRSQYLCSHSTQITTVEELLAKARVDLDRWEVDRFTVNQWEVGAKVKDADGSESMTVKPLYQIKAWIKRRAPEEVGALLAMREIWKHAPKYPKTKLPKPKGDWLLELSLPDVHFGKLAWLPETGQDYDLHHAQKVFRDALTHIVGLANKYPIEQVLFVVGNDYFNTDNGRDTTAGTPQDEDGRWQKTFQYGSVNAIWAVDVLRQIAPTTVYVIPGNHDTQRSFYLGEMLAAWFGGCTPADNVVINNSPESRKYFRYHQSILGYTHGDKEKPDDLPDLMASERPADYVDCRWRMWRLGHLHHHRRTKYVSKITHRETIVEHYPSLAGSDYYHKSRGYSGERSAKATLIHKDRGPQIDLWHFVKGSND